MASVFTLLCLLGRATLLPSRGVPMLSRRRVKCGSAGASPSPKIKQDGEITLVVY